GVIPPPFVPRNTILVIGDAVADTPLYRKAFGEGSLDSFAFSPDGQRFVTAGETVAVRDTASGKECATFKERTWRVALAPDGKRAVIAGGDSRVRLWDLEARKPMQDLCPGFVYIASDTLKTRQAFSADGKLLLPATDTTLRLFDTTT